MIRRIVVLLGPLSLMRRLFEFQFFPYNSAKVDFVGPAIRIFGAVFLVRGAGDAGDRNKLVHVQSRGFLLNHPFDFAGETLLRFFSGQDLRLLLFLHLLQHFVLHFLDHDLHFLKGDFLFNQSIQCLTPLQPSSNRTPLLSC